MGLMLLPQVQAGQTANPFTSVLADRRQGVRLKRCRVREVYGEIYQRGGMKHRQCSGEARYNSSSVDRSCALCEVTRWAIHAGDSPETRRHLGLLMHGKNALVLY